MPFKRSLVNTLRSAAHVTRQVLARIARARLRTASRSATVAEPAPHLRSIRAILWHRLRNLSQMSFPASAAGVSFLRALWRARGQPMSPTRKQQPSLRLVRVGWSLESLSALHYSCGASLPAPVTASRKRCWRDGRGVNSPSNSSGTNKKQQGFESHCVLSCPA